MSPAVCLFFHPSFMARKLHDYTCLWFKKQTYLLTDIQTRPKRWVRGTFWWNEDLVLISVGLRRCFRFRLRHLCHVSRRERAPILIERLFTLERRIPANGQHSQPCFFYLSLSSCLSFAIKWKTVYLAMLTLLPLACIMSSEWTSLIFLL